MTDKINIIGQIEDLIGSECTEGLGEAMFDIMRDDGLIDFDAYQGFHFTELYIKKYDNANDDGTAWNALLSRADEALANHAD